MSRYYMNELYFDTHSVLQPLPMTLFHLLFSSYILCCGIIVGAIKVLFDSPLRVNFGQFI